MEKRFTVLFIIILLLTWVKISVKNINNDMKTEMN